MNPSPAKTPEELAEEFEVSEKIAHQHANHVFAQELALHAHHLRMQAKQDEKNDQLSKD